MKTIAIAGANGRIGREAVTAFQTAGWQVIAITRHGKLTIPATHIDGAEVIDRAADALNQQQLIEACRGADIVLNALNPVYTDWHDKVMPMATNIIAACKATGARQLLAGNVYNYGRNIPALVMSRTPHSAETRKGRLRVEMEALFEQASKADNIQTVVLRAGDFFGGIGRGSWFDLKIGSDVAKGIVTYPGPIDQVHAWAYLPDLARAFTIVAENMDGFDGFDEVLFGGYSVTGAEFIDAIERNRPGQPPLKVKSIPWWIISAGGTIIPMWREIAEISYLWHMPHQLDNSRFEAIAPDFKATPLHEAMRQSLEAIGQMDQAA